MIELTTAVVLLCSPAGPAQTPQNTTVIRKTNPATFKQRWLAIYFRDRAK